MVDGLSQRVVDVNDFSNNLDPELEGSSKYFSANTLHLSSNNSVLPFTPEEMRKMLAKGFGSEGVLTSRRLPKVHSIKRQLGKEACAEIA